MAHLDPVARELVVRVVYDGPGRAGKTTTLAGIAKHRGLSAPTEHRGAGGLLFESLEFVSGSIGEYAVRVELVTTPGQLVHGRKRERILQSADAVVFVCDVSAASEAANQEALASLMETLGAREAEIPIVLQANKIDRRDAMSSRELRQRLQLSSRVAIFRSRATDGLGVREALNRVLGLCRRKFTVKLRLDGTSAFDSEGESLSALADALRGLERASSPSSSTRVSVPEIPPPLAAPRASAARLRAPRIVSDATRRRGTPAGEREGVGEAAQGASLLASGESAIRALRGLLQELRATAHTGELRVVFAKSAWTITAAEGRLLWVHDDATPTLLRSLLQSELALDTRTTLGVSAEISLTGDPFVTALERRGLHPYSRIRAGLRAVMRAFVDQRVSLVGAYRSHTLKRSELYA